MSNKYKSTATSHVTKDKIEMLPLSAIKNKFDVRMALDQDRVIQFAAIYEGGEITLPPIEVVKLTDGIDGPIEYAFIDGRTRAAARQYLNLTEVPAIVRNGNLRDDPAALYARALEANWGGAKPPTRADIEHTILRMLESGVSRTEIKDILTFLPTGSLRAYLANALSTLNKRRIGRALDAINDGTNIETAAKQNQLKVDQLKDVLAEKKGKWGKSRINEVQTITELKAYISSSVNGCNRGIANKLFRFLQQVEDGEISLKGAVKVGEFWAEHARKTALRVADWQTRVLAIAESQAKAAGQQPEQPAVLSEVKLPKPPKVKIVRPTADESANYIGVRMGQGFWNEELPRAMRASGAKTAGQLVEYFANNGKNFTVKQVGGALERLRKRGMTV